MSARLAPHGGSLDVLPPQASVDVHIERTSNHWYWLDEFHDNDGIRTAYFMWTPPGKVSTRFIVARLLWCWLHDAVDVKRLSLTNTCGLATCINPLHWHRVFPSINVVNGEYTLPTASDARLAQYAKYSPRTTIHMCRVHIVRHDSQYAVCGVTAKRLHPVLDTDTTRAAVTCTDCARAWSASGGALVEIKPL